MYIVHILTIYSFCFIKIDISSIKMFEINQQIVSKSLYFVLGVENTFLSVLVHIRISAKQYIQGYLCYREMMQTLFWQIQNSSGMCRQTGSVGQLMNTSEIRECGSTSIYISTIQISLMFKHAIVYKSGSSPRYISCGDESQNNNNNAFSFRPIRAQNGGCLANEGASPSIVMWTGARNLSDLSQILEAGLSSVKRNKNA